MNRKHLITLAVLSALGGVAASAHAAGNDDPAFGAMPAATGSALTREEVRAELFAARAEGRMEWAGEITTPDSVLVAMENHNKAVMLAAAQKAEILAAAQRAEAEAALAALTPQPADAALPGQSSGETTLSGGSSEMMSTDLLPGTLQSTEPVAEPQPVMPEQPNDSLPVNTDMAPAPTDERVIVGDGIVLQPVVMLVDLDENGEPMLIETVDID